MSANLERFALWREMTLGLEAELTIPALLAVQAAWRSEPTFEAATMAAIAECNRQGPDVWASIASAGVEAVSRMDESDQQTLAEALEQAKGMNNPSMRKTLEAAARAHYRETASVEHAWGLDPEKTAEAFENYHDWRKENNL